MKKQAGPVEWLARQCRLYRQGVGCAWLWVVGIGLAIALPVYVLSAHSFLSASMAGAGAVLLVSWGASRRR